MLRKLQVVLLICFIQNAKAQLTTNNSLTPAQMVQNVLLGTGITVSNVSYTGYVNGISTFNATPSVNLGFSSGVYLTSGSCLAIDPLGYSGGQDGPFGPSSKFQDVYIGQAGDADLDLLTSGVTEDAAVLEFDFIPKSDTVKFRYRFASEEYNDFVSSSYNDVFGFFLTGVTVAFPKKNIALIPGTTTPVSINTVNNGYSTGASTGPCNNCQYYTDNIASGINIVYDGITKTLTAISPVQCGQTYHIKMAIADVGDGAYDSGVFLEAGSFSSADPISITTNLTDTTTTEGCGATSLYFVRPQSQSSNAVTYTYTLGGTATNGVDFTPALPGSITFPAGQDTVVITLTAINDGVVEPIEVLNININQTFTLCGGPLTVSGKFYIKSFNASISSQSQVNCYGTSTGSATVAANGGTSPYTYSWAPSGGTSASISNAAAGTYVCTVTDVHNCTSTQSVTITQPAAALASSISAQTTIACYGNSTGSASITASGGTSPYTYSWAPSGGTSASISNVSAGTYICTITDAKNCTKTQSVTITQPAAALASVISSQSQVNCYGNSTGSASITASGGTSPYTYSWAPVGGTSASISNVSVGTYICTITDAKNCTNTQSVTITQPAAALSSVISSQSQVNCNGASTGSASVTASGGTSPYAYSWTGNTSTTGSISNVSAGTYICTITDANNCTSTQSVTITQPVSALSSVIAAQSMVNCFGNATGSASVAASGGTSPYSYSWTGNTSTSGSISNVNAGTYICTITDANNCTSTQSVNITQPVAALSSVISSQNMVNCFGNNTGSASVTASGGTSPYTYNWVPYNITTAGIINMSAGTYVCTITDAHNCTSTQSVTITQPSAALSSLISSQSMVNCFGNSTGSATLTASGGTLPYTYNWTPTNMTTAGISNVSAGTYICTITDANNCTSTQSVTITQPSAALSSSISAQSMVDCYGNSTGSATVAVNGGTSPYTYNWTPNNSTTAGISNVSAGTYICTITDANNCTDTQSVSISQPTQLTVLAHADSVCSGLPSTISALAAGGNGGYTYSWTPNGINTPSFSTLDLVPVNYSITVTDINGCTTVQGISSVVLNSPTASISNNAANGIYTMPGHQGTLCYTDNTSGATAWNWTFDNNGGSVIENPCVNVNAPGTYCAQLIVTNVFGCTDTINDCIVVEESRIVVPNIFTPNLDGKNDVFTIDVKGYHDLNCEIFDRWGLKVYEWQGLSGGWDGLLLNGNTASDGTYYWIVTLVSDAGKNTNQSGHLLLTR